jgi:hypothetical protein
MFMDQLKYTCSDSGTVRLTVRRNKISRRNMRHEAGKTRRESSDFTFPSSNSDTPQLLST